MENHARQICLAAVIVLSPFGAAAEDLDFPPEATHISFGFDSTLHYVEGVAELEEGHLRFDPAGGEAAGRIVIDATSLDTGNGLRDGQMHEKVLESARFPRIEFLPEALSVGERSADRAEVTLAGRIQLHGGEWPLEIPATVSLEGERLRIRGTFRIPHVAWGLRDMSNFLLHVDDEVEVTIDSLVDFGTPQVAAGAPGAIESGGAGGTGLGQ